MGGRQTKSASKLDRKAVSKLRSLFHEELSEEDIQSCYKTYQENRNSGKELTKEEFKKFYSKLFQCETSDFAEHVFRTFDINNDGHLDFQEFFLGLFLSASKDTHTKIHWAFKVYDIDGDGTISWAEMRNIVQSISNMTSDKTLDQIDKDFTERVCPVRRVNQPTPLSNSPGDADNTFETRDMASEIADKIFMELDTDKDGAITLEEFMDGAVKLPLVVSLLESCFE